MTTRLQTSYYEIDNCYCGTLNQVLGFLLLNGNRRYKVKLGFFFCLVQDTRYTSTCISILARIFHSHGT